MIHPSLIGFFDFPSTASLTEGLRISVCVGLRSSRKKSGSGGRIGFQREQEHLRSPVRDDAPGQGEVPEKEGDEKKSEEGLKSTIHLEPAVKMESPKKDNL
ncbi:hypothetical protein RIF29_43646 [Crotalaria pallida]|uniref:Uncharacterized protein n=1 Tax=Crotalaria pallida TaxID=3830 RepID=A0AAN9HMM8_CROPI